MKTPAEIIKEKYSFYDENYVNQDVELDGKQITELMIKYADQFKQVSVEPEVKPANADFGLIEGMYAILAEQNNAIWEKISGRTKQANERVEKLIPMMKQFEKELEKRLSV